MLQHEYFTNMEIRNGRTVFSFVLSSQIICSFRGQITLTDSLSEMTRIKFSSGVSYSNLCRCPRQSINADVIVQISTFNSLKTAWFHSDTANQVDRLVRQPNGWPTVKLERVRQNSRTKLFPRFISYQRAVNGPIIHCNGQSTNIREPEEKS